MSDLMNPNVIGPDDERWFVDGSDLTVFAQIAVDRDTCVFAASLDGGAYDFDDPGQPYTRFYKYSKKVWTCAEVRARIVSMTLYREPGWSTDGLAVLGEDGQIWFLGQHGHQSRIDNPDASLLSRIRVLDGTLYATGHGGKIFRREGSKWRTDDTGLRAFVSPVPRPRQSDRGSASFAIRDLIYVPDSRDFYVCGAVYTARPALFWRRDSGKWSWLNLDTQNIRLDYASLHRLYADSPSSIWISTQLGFLLNGSAQNGFKIATDEKLTEDGELINFSNFVRFRGDLFVGGTCVCRILEGRRLEPQIGAPVRTMGEPDYVSTAISGVLGIGDDVLWAIGHGVLSRFDGATWERIVMPSVYRSER